MKPSSLLALALLAGAVAGAAVNIAQRAVFPDKPQVVHLRGAVTDRAAARHAAVAWPELEQAKVDSLTAALKGVTARPVTIYCRERTLCGDLALDLENGFESARWTVNVEAPLIDYTVGIASNDRELAATVAKATGLDVKLVEPRQAAACRAPEAGQMGNVNTVCMPPAAEPVYIALGRRR